MTKAKADELSASDRLLKELTIATDASIGVIVIRCPETETYRVADDLYALAMTNNTEFRLHTAETGWGTFERVDPEDRHGPVFDPLNPKEANKSSAAVQQAFALMQSDAFPREGYFVMLDLYFSFAEMATQTALRKQAQRALSNSQRLFLIVPNHAEIPEAIAPLMHIIQFGYPTRDELGSSLDDIIDNLDDDDKPTIAEDERQAIIANGQGMNLNSFETAIALSITTYTSDTGSMDGFSASDIMDSIRAYKTAMLRKTNVLELQPTVSEKDIGGLDLFKEWMHQRRLTYTAKARGSHVMPSRGALVVGPPGTGKSLVAKAAGSILNLPVVRFDVGRVFGQYIGQSEQQMRSVLALVDAMAPLVLMLDEIDKGFSGMNSGGGDSGTTQRVFGTFLTWMQERNQLDRPVFLIMTANRIAGLPPELLRKGRVDEIWSVNMPNDDEREQIVSIHLAKRKQDMDRGDIKGAVRLADGLVGAEIEALIEDALVMSLAGDTPGVTYELLEKAKGYLKPMAVTRASEFTEMQQWAEQNARPASSGMRSSDTSEPPRSIRRGKARPRPQIDRSR